MKNVLLTTTALVAMAGAAAADVSWSGSADIGHNDVIKGGLFYDVNVDLVGAFDLGDGFAATISYGLDLETGSAVTFDAMPTIEITSPYGSLKGGDLGDKGASEYFYADRDGMALDVENHDSSSRFDVRALAEFGDFGFAVGGDNDGAGNIDGVSVGAGTTFGNVTVALGYDAADTGLLASTTAVTTAVDALVGGETDAAIAIAVAADAAATAALPANVAAVATASLATTAVSLGTTIGGATVGLSYISNTVDTSTGVAVGFDVSADLSVGVYYANNSGADNAYGVSADYTMGALTVGAYYDAFDGTTANEMGLDVSYAVSADLTLYAGVFDDGATASYVGAVYAINDSLTATVSFAEADEISGPEFKDGTTVMLSASF